MVQDTETQLDNLVFRNSLSTRTTAIELSSHIGKTKSNFDELEARLASLESTVASQGNELANHENQIRILESATHGFAALRHRFLSTAKRDIFGFALTQADNERVAAVDSSAPARRYGGNCVFDAKLYEPGGGGRRRDFRTYEKLYGLHPGVVGMIDYRPTLNVLDLHATYLVSDRHTVTPRFVNAFGNFVCSLEEFEYRGNYLEGVPTNLSKAYWEFTECVREDSAE